MCPKVPKEHDFLIGKSGVLTSRLRSFLEKAKPPLAVGALPDTKQSLARLAVEWVTRCGILALA